MKKIQPFSNGTEFMQWQDQNCNDCKCYENNSTERSKAKCKAAFDIDSASASDGYIPLSSAEFIGMQGSRISECKMKNIIFTTVKFDREKMKQTNLFNQVTPRIINMPTEVYNFSDGDIEGDEDYE
jgi:hypothetical protein